jgi:WD40 repeat protein
MASIEDKVARVWDIGSGKALARLEGNAEAVYAVAFAPDGKTILTGGEDDTIRLFDAKTGRAIGTLPKSGGGNVHALAFLPEGRRALSGDEGILLRVWSLADGKTLAEYEGPIWGTHLIAVAPGGTVFTGNGDSTVRVLKLDTPRKRAGQR